jgi:hypothetical protein
MKMKAGVILGQQLVVQANRFLETNTKNATCHKMYHAKPHIHNDATLGVVFAPQDEIEGKRLPIAQAFVFEEGILEVSINREAMPLM